VVGAATVLTRGARWQVFTGGMGVGEWLLLGCIATWVGYTLLGRRLLAGIDALTATAVSATIGVVLLWLLAFAVDGVGPALGGAARLDVPAWASLLFLAVGATVLAYAWFFDGVGKLGAGVATSYISLVPVFGVSSSVLMLGEPLEASLLVGGGLALLGVVINNRAR
jgi:drug/metabolite transporter (DMT)-like permease